MSGCMITATGWRDLPYAATRAVGLRTPGTGGHGWLASGVRGMGWRQVLRQKAGQRVKQEMPGAEVGRGGPDAPPGMSSKAVDDEDQRSMSSLMRKRGRSGPRARRTSIRRVPESRSCSIGPAKWLPPNRSSPPCPVRCQLSSAATHASNGTPTIRRNDSDPGAEPALTIMLA